MELVRDTRISYFFYIFCFVRTVKTILFLAKLKDNWDIKIKVAAPHQPNHFSCKASTSWYIFFVFLFTYICI